MWEAWSDIHHGQKIMACASSLGVDSHEVVLLRISSFPHGRSRWKTLQEVDMAGFSWLDGIRKMPVRKGYRASLTFHLWRVAHPSAQQAIAVRPMKRSRTDLDEKQKLLGQALQQHYWIRTNGMQTWIQFYSTLDHRYSVASLRCEGCVWG